jgi:hypothetical protein
VIWLVLAVCLGLGVAAAGATTVVLLVGDRSRGDGPQGRPTRGDAGDDGGDAGLPDAGSHAPVAAACPPGEVSQPGAPGRCCWPGQTWSDAARQCQGRPQCPPGLVERQSRCRCPEGQVKNANTAGRCCWPRQAWSASEGRCMGRPVCPPGFWLSGDACMELPPCPPGKVSSAATQGRCCWPGQSWSAGLGGCAGPASCERGFEAAAAGASCAPDRTALGRTIQACLDGQNESCVNLGLAYQQGDGVDRDPRRAAHLYRTACEGGVPIGCHDLGVLYDNGLGVGVDHAQAVALYKRACDGGAAQGCVGLGTAYHLGQGAELDLLRAASVYEKACRTGEAHGCNNFGLLHVDGAGVPQDFGKAGAHFQRACDLGNANGCCSAGILHLRGLGLPRDDSRARGLMERACEGGERWACDWLADPSLLGPVLQRLTYRAVATAVEGDAPIGQGAECRVVVAPAFMCSYNCRVRVSCGQDLLYGAGTMGYNSCRIEQTVGAPPSIEVHDAAASPSDGDPRIDLWTNANRAAVGDEGEDSTWSATLELSGLVAQ